MKLHKIEFLHAAPKDTEQGIKYYVVADSETAICDRVDKEHNFSGWSEHEEEVNIYDDNYEIIGTETYMSRMLRLRGDINDDDVDFSDAYYGITLHGWDEGVDVTDADAEVLMRLGIAKDWRDAALGATS